MLELSISSHRRQGILEIQRLFTQMYQITNACQHQLWMEHTLYDSSNVCTVYTMHLYVKDMEVFVQVQDRQLQKRSTALEVTQINMVGMPYLLRLTGLS